MTFGMALAIACLVGSFAALVVLLAFAAADKWLSWCERVPYEDEGGATSHEDVRAIGAQAPCPWPRAD